jgi:hypothetical protein
MCDESRLENEYRIILMMASWTEINMLISSRAFSNINIELKFSVPEISSMSNIGVDVEASNFTCSGIDEMYIIGCVKKLC